MNRCVGRSRWLVYCCCFHHQNHGGRCLWRGLKLKLFVDLIDVVWILREHIFVFKKLFVFYSDLLKVIVCVMLDLVGLFELSVKHEQWFVDSLWLSFARFLPPNIIISVTWADCRHWIGWIEIVAKSSGLWTRSRFVVRLKAESDSMRTALWVFCDNWMTDSCLHNICMFLAHLTFIDYIKCEEINYYYLYQILWTILNKKYTVKSMSVNKTINIANIGWDDFNLVRCIIKFQYHIPIPVFLFLLGLLQLELSGWWNRDPASRHNNKRAQCLRRRGRSIRMPR